ncbi:hypothetical protein O6H91_20G037400 [Diphasiastrum complanatum]|uniref:Uncharacterized protein n=1 Tax=Diphasiastrum complanatum TaxID=34168 RepID=A0ACC2AP90_DIPCM|nr:hypothetical protein O6H91_20G037400 [Diphasiastrum complanatum]
MYQSLQRKKHRILLFMPKRNRKREREREREREEMKRRWAISEELRAMAEEQMPQTSQSLPSSSEACPSESTTSRHALLPQKDVISEKEMRIVNVKEEEFEQAVVHRIVSLDRIQLEDVAREELGSVTELMNGQPEEYLEELKAELRGILSGTDGPSHRDRFALLQKLVQSRRDLSAETLMQTHRIQLEILVAIKTGIQAFLHPDISVTQSVLIEIFFHRRCRNMACQSQLPVDDCNCEVCMAKKGFCKACMCVLCSKFDFDVNTCTWVGCDFCSHWTHTDCAIRFGHIHMGSNQRKKLHRSEMMFQCKACGCASELLGWVKDIFRACADDWDRDGLMKELDCVRRIFHGSEDEPGKRVYWKSEELLEKLKNGIDLKFALKEMQHFFLAMETKTNDSVEDEHGKVIEPSEACDRIAEVVQEAVHKMGIVSTDKVQDVNRAKLSLQLCDRELDEKRRELGELETERQQKRQEINELETIIRLKQAEAEMFQLRAEEAQQEADELTRIVQARHKNAEEDYAAKYLKLRLKEAEAERRYLFEKMKLQDLSRMMPDSSQMATMYMVAALRGSAPTPSR